MGRSVPDSSVEMEEGKEINGKQIGKNKVAIPSALLEIVFAPESRPNQTASRDCDITLRTVIVGNDINPYPLLILGA